MKKFLSLLLTVAMLFTVAAFSASAADTDVAAIADVTYATLKDAITAAKAGDTVKLLGDVTENVTVGKKITLDGDGKTYKGQLTISTSFTADNVNFVDATIYKTAGSNNDVTVKNCKFNGSYNNGYAINLRGTRNVVIENCEAQNVGGFLQIPKTNNSVTVKNVTIDNATYGMKVDYNNATTLENVTMTNVSCGFYTQTYGEKTITFKNCKIAAADPADAIYVRERSAKIQTLVFKGENDFGVDLLSFASDLVKVKLDVAAIGTETYATLKEAVEAAADGDVIKVLADHEIASSEAFLSSVYTGYYVFAEATDKKVTIDLNGKVITINPDLDKMMLAVLFTADKGDITLKDSSEAQTGAINVTATDATSVYSMFTADMGGKFTIENGNYYLNKVDVVAKAPRAMLYAGDDKHFTVNGGNFVLANAHTTTAPYHGSEVPQPWIANVQGEWGKSLLINGGTFNVNPSHHTGEVVYPVCHKPVETDGKWVITLVHTPGAAATCQAPQVCTVCTEELDAIKACTFENYVSDGNATCKDHGTKTAECIYGCGNTDTVVDEDTALKHTDADGNGRCDGCDSEFCDSCGKIHEDWLSKLFCLILDLIDLVISFFSSVR